MGLRDWLPWLRADRRELTPEKFREYGLLDPPTAAGVTVSERTALTLPAFWSGVNLIATAVAKLPRKVYKSLPDGSREEAPDHGVAWIIQQEPNSLSTPFTFWRAFLAHVLTWGNGYAEIERDRANRPIALWLLTPDSVEPVVEGGVLSYRWRGRALLPAEDVLHVSGLGFDGVKGYSVVQYARQTLGLGLAAERYGAAFFGNGAVPGVIFEHPGRIGEEAQKRLLAGWNAMHQGPDRAHRAAILEENMKANVLSVAAKDAQLIETRELSVLDVARVLCLNPAMLGYKTAERPGGNYEAGRLDFLDNTLDPWLVALEQECNRKLLSTQERGTYFVEHVRNAVLRTDAKTRADVQKVYVDMGAMTAEHVAKLENLPKPEERDLPLASKVEAVGQLIRAGFDPEAAAQAVGLPAIPHTGMLPVTVQAESDPAPPPSPGAPAPEPEPEPAGQQRAAWRRVVVDVLSRMVRLEAERARRAAAQGPEKFNAWIDEFYPGHEVRLREALEPVVRGWSEACGREDWRGALNAIASRLVQESREELLEAKVAALEADVDARVGRWERERPGVAAETILEAA